MSEENELATVDDDPDAVDASGQDELVEQTDNSGEEGEDAPQGVEDVVDDDAAEDSESEEASDF